MNSVIRKFALACLVATFVTANMYAQDQPQVVGPSGSTVYVKIAQSADLKGELAALNSITVKTSFGEISIPMEKLEGIKMNIGSNGKAVIAFTNGDIITGQVTLDKLQLKTNWGTAHIDPVHIETITMDEDGRFFKDGPSGTGAWRFSKAVEVPTRGNSRTSTVPRRFGQ